MKSSSGESYARKQANKYLYLTIIVVLLPIIFFSLLVSVYGWFLLFIVLYGLARSGILDKMLSRWAYASKGVYSKHTRWDKGAVGEEIVADSLKKIAGYKIFNDISLPTLMGNVDHLIVGKKGIFVLETKNFVGRFVVEKDRWSKDAGEKLINIKSPSSQVKRTAVKVKEFIEANTGIKKLFVQGIVIVPNENCEVEVKEPTVPILKPSQVENFVNGQRQDIPEKYIRQIVSLVTNAKAADERGDYSVLS